VSGFDADWLALRAPADDRARATALETELAAVLGARARGAPWLAVDLATGTGANLRRLAPRLPGPQRWRLVDADPALLAHAAGAARGLHAADGGAVEAVVERRDLATADLDALCAGAALVTASALLDLVSAAWLERLADAITRTRAVALFALDYDGRRECTPVEPLDAAAHAAFDAHQRGDKGFGPALGPAAAAYAAEAFAGRGFRVVRARSDWALGPADGALQSALIEGWATAAIEREPERREAHAAWRSARIAHVANGHSRVVVGHEDLLVVPEG
jgi:hypothetical protein